MLAGIVVAITLLIFDFYFNKIARELGTHEIFMFTLPSPCDNDYG